MQISARCARAKCAMPSLSMVDDANQSQHGPDRDTDTRAELARTDRLPPIPRKRPPRQSAAPGYQAAPAEFPAGRARRGGWRAPARRIRSTHRGWSRKGGLLAAPRPSGPPGRPAAAPRRSSAASQSGTPGRPCRYRFPARAMRWRLPRAARRSSSRCSASSRKRARKASVMRQDCVLAQPLGQLVGDALRQPAGVDEHQRGAILLRQRRRCDRRSRPTSPCSRPRPTHREEPRPPDPWPGDARLARCARRSLRNCATSSMGLTVAERPIFCSGAPVKRFQPRDRQCQMRPALVIGHRVNLVDDQRAHGREHFPRPLRGEQNVQ